MPQQSIYAMLNLLTQQLDRDSVVELVDLYLNNAPRQLNAIRAAVKNHDLKSLWFEAHGLKSSSANLGANDLSQACLRVEKSTQIDKSTLEHIERVDALLKQATGFMTDWKNSSP